MWQTRGVPAVWLPVSRDLCPAQSGHVPDRVRGRMLLQAQVSAQFRGQVRQAGKVHRLLQEGQGVVQELGIG